MARFGAYVWSIRDVDNKGIVDLSTDVFGKRMDCVSSGIQAFRSLSPFYESKNRVLCVEQMSCDSSCAYYTTYEKRLETFKAYWPKYAPIKPEELAAAGFYYVGRGDVCKCISCGLKLFQWREGDVVLEEHKKHNSEKGGACLMLDLLFHKKKYGCLPSSQNSQKSNTPPPSIGDCCGSGIICNDGNQLEMSGIVLKRVSIQSADKHVYKFSKTGRVFESDKRDILEAFLQYKDQTKLEIDNSDSVMDSK